MITIPLGEARDRLSEFVAQVESAHDRVAITRHGRPAAVLISPDDLSSLEETLDLMTTPGEADAIREGVADASLAPKRSRSATCGDLCDQDHHRNRIASANRCSASSRACARPDGVHTAWCTRFKAKTVAVEVIRIAYRADVYR
ncbi:type II toxin-antitoxin system Phd/YefM family antitoxin [Saccharopolyspora soli]|uniref:type II toxin-antitoxin system Phd/YefM family antitoxin n=1 Tax=Saccharopolyspora soli TaxID=2926618 RepID=UPI002413AE93|nr:type II toxin-antitoxin system Phd/YefM family antitoxin [Saccharopolyspora soli]